MKIDYPATIIKVRATLNLSQVELAEVLDVSFASVNRWENGKYEPTRLVKEKIRLGEWIEKMRFLCYNKLSDKLEFVRMIRWSI